MASSFSSCRPPAHQYPFFLSFQVHWKLHMPALLKTWCSHVMWPFCGQSHGNRCHCWAVTTASFASVTMGACVEIESTPLHAWETMMNKALPKQLTWILGYVGLTEIKLCLWSKPVTQILWLFVTAAYPRPFWLIQGLRLNGISSAWNFYTII